jgi:hypothetical protein
MSDSIDGIFAVTELRVPRRGRPWQRVGCCIVEITELLAAQ